MELAKNEIQKAKIKDGQLSVTYEENFTEENYSNTIDKKCAQTVHVDLREAFDKLKLHLVCICEMPEAEQVKKHGIYDFNLEDNLNNYIVTGYSKGGNGESAGAVILGQKLLSSGKVLNITTPFIQFEDEEAYEFSGDLYAHIEGCDYEVSEYLFNEKWGIKQLDFDFDSPDESSIGENITITVKEEKPKRKKKKKEEKIPAFDTTA